MNFFSLFKRKIIYSLKKKHLIDHDGINLKSLDDLFHHYGSDKANFFIKKNSMGHGFSKFYEKKLENLKDKKINILEIGSFSGASAAAFVKYLPNARVVCLDINISNFAFKSKKIHVFGVDINNKTKISKIFKTLLTSYQIGKFDIIIDDGSHNLSDIINAIKLFFNYLIDGGLYVIEDYKHPNYYKYNRNINHILIDEILNNIENKKKFNSNILNENDQNKLFKLIKKVEIFRGNLKDSDICFIEKK